MGGKGGSNNKFTSEKTKENKMGKQDQSEL